MAPKKPLFDFPLSMAPKKPLFDEQSELEESSTSESSSEEEESLSNKHLSTPEGDAVEESSEGVEESSEEGESEGEGEKDEPKVSEVLPIVEKQQTILPSQSPADSGGGGGEEEESEKSLDLSWSRFYLFSVNNEQKLEKEDKYREGVEKREVRSASSSLPKSS